MTQRDELRMITFLRNITGRCENHVKIRCDLIFVIFIMNYKVVDPNVDTGNMLGIYCITGCTNISNTSNQRKKRARLISWFETISGNP